MARFEANAIFLKMHGSKEFSNIGMTDKIKVFQKMTTHPDVKADENWHNLQNDANLCFNLLGFLIVYLILLYNIKVNHV